MIETIEKLSEVNTTVSRMLAVHEERLSKQEEIDTVLFTKIDKLRDKMDADHDSVLQRLRGLEKRCGWQLVDWQSLPLAQECLQVCQIY